MFSPNSPLVTYALRKTGAVLAAEHGRWSYFYHLDGRASQISPY
ncbi:hypothetical protein ABIA00_007810 [Bradyrhizobium ottawaense]